VISRVQNSTEAIAIAWNDAVEKGLNHRQDFLRQVLIKSGLGIDDITEDEIQTVNNWKSSEKTVEELSWIFSDMVSRRALIGVSSYVYIQTIS
jgi:alkaline phosphatase